MLRRPFLPAISMVVVCALTALVAIPLAPAPACSAPAQVPTVRLEARQEVAAAPAAIWQWATTGHNLITWCPRWKSANNARVNLTRVGDVLDYTDEWGHGGRSIVTYYAAGRELRVAHEPDDGSYLCQARLLLEPRGSSTVVRYIEQYTDSSKPADLAATAGKVEADMKSTLLALKRGVEQSTAASSAAR
jgi:hypothetical protein